MRKLFGLGLLLGAFWAVGCGDNSAPTAGGDKSSPKGTNTAAVGEPNVVEPSQGANAPAVAGAVMPPNEVVALFFDSMRRGDEVQTAGLLTAKAREELAKYELVVQPPGSPLATYQVGRISYLDDAKDSAYVESILNEPTGNGQETKPWEIVWAVRLEADGWKIAGFAFEISDDQAPMVVDFENGADMKAKIEGTAPQPTQQPPTQTAENPALPAATGEVRR
jgi:hypothetical protein